MKHRHRSQKRSRVRRILFFEHLDARLLLAASDVSRVPFWDGETTDPAGSLINRTGGPAVIRAGGATVSHETGVVHAGQGAFRVTPNGTLPAHSFDFFALALTGFGPSSDYVNTRDLTGFDGVEFWVRNETGKPFNLVFEIRDHRDSNDHRARFNSAVSATAAWTPISMPLVLHAAHGWQVIGSPDLARTKLFALVIETGMQAIDGSFFIDDMVLIEKGGPLNPATADGNALIDRVMWRGFRGLWGSRDVNTGLIPNNSAQADVMALNSTAALVAMLPTAIQQGELAAADADEYVGTAVDKQYSLYADYGEPDLFMPWAVGSAFLATPDFALEALRDILQRDFHGPLGLSDSVHIATGAAMPTTLAARTDFWNQSLVTLALMEYRYGSNEFLTALPEVQSALDKVLPPVAPFGPLPDALTTSRNWIAFTPRNYNPNVGQFPTEAQLRADLQQLYDDGWRGIVTYTLDGTLRHVPRLAKEIGFTKVIGGIYWYDAAQLAREKAAVAEVDPFVDAYVVGNEGLLEERYTRVALEREIAAIKLLTGKPVATTETGGQYLADPTLLDVGDWVFPNIQPFCSQPAIRSVADAVAHTSNEFLAIRAAAVARAPDRVVALKETWWPTADDAAATQANQAEYFRQLAQTDAVFVWGESFDQPWKFEPGCYNQGRSWGLYRADGDFKAAIPQLHTVYVSGQTVPPDSDGDGISDAVEDDAPNQGDGNGDQIPDRLQSNVASLPNAVDGRYLTLAVAAPAIFTDVRAVGNPSPGDAPEGIDFRAGFVDFVVTGAGASVTVEVFLDQTAGINTFYRFGQTEAGGLPHWYRYLSKGSTGAEILPDRTRLRLVDGGRGDDDLLVSGTISARGAPAADLRLHPWQNPQEPLDVNDDGHVVPLDALVLINEINANQSRVLAVPPAPPNVAYYFLDPNGDDRLTPIDVLVVINHLNAQAASAAAEGEAAAGYAGWLFSRAVETAHDSFFAEVGRASSGEQKEYIMATGSWRSQPAFITSALADMQAQRDWLRDHVIPELKEQLRERRHHLGPTDLGCRDGHGRQVTRPGIVLPSWQDQRRYEFAISDQSCE